MDAHQDLMAAGDKVLREDGMAEYVAWLLDNMERIKELEPDPSPEFLEKMEAKREERRALDRALQQSARPSLPFCENCGAYTWWDDVLNSEEVCQECGLCVPYICSDGRALTRDDQDRFEDFKRTTGRRRAYERMSHFNDTLNQLFSRQKRCVAPHVLETVRAAAVGSGEDPETLSGVDVRRHLKKAKLGKHNEEAFLIAAQLGRFRQVLALSHQAETDLRIMFRRMQRPFELHKGPKRKSFLNMRYVLFQLLRKAGYPHIARHIPLLKSKARLAEHDRIFQRICEHLGWSFSPVLGD